METLSLIQGSQEWHAHRAAHFNASDAPAMLDCSPYMTRTELLARMKTGLSAEVDAHTQRRFDDGHRFEALARPVAEKIVGEDLYAVTGTNGKLSASFDGLTLLEDTVFEHKSLGESLRYTPWDEGNGDHLPKHFRVQMEQQLLVSGAKRVLFMASKWNGDEMVEERHCWYASDSKLRDEIKAGWAQFEKDLEAYVVPDAAPPAPVAKVVAHLPVVLDMRVEGKLVASNLDKYKPAALAYIAAINIELESDQQFADADADAKFCRESAAKLKLAREQALGQMGDINAALNAVGEIAAAFDAKGLALEKLVKAEKDRRRAEIVTKPAQALRAHIDALNLRIGKPLMPPIPADFAGVVKGLRSLSSMENAASTELARAKIAANERADAIQINLAKVNERAELAFLFPDVVQLVLKAPEDLQALVTNRITEHQRQEAAKEEAQRERIRQEEADKLQREAEAKRLADEAAAEAQRKADEAIKTAATPAPAAPAPVAAPAVQAESSNVLGVGVPLRSRAPAPAPVAEEKATMKLGEITTRLRFTVTADFLAELGFEAVVDKGARLYRPSDFPRICDALIQHITTVADEVVV